MVPQSAEPRAVDDALHDDGGSRFICKQTSEILCMSSYCFFHMNFTTLISVALLQETLTAKGGGEEEEEKGKEEGRSRR